jgi:hypothetical protein
MSNRVSPVTMGCLDCEPWTGPGACPTGSPYPTFRIKRGFVPEYVYVKL